MFYDMAKKVTIVFLSIICLLLFIPINSFAQDENIKFEHLTVEHGLSSNTVYTIVQDSKGFMWFGTEDGLNKYDGYTFTIYKNDAHDSTSLSNSYIHNIYEDKKGILWVGTLYGLNKYNREQDRFTRFLYNPNDSSSLSNNNITRIFESNHDQEDILWLGTSNGLIKFYRASGKCNVFYPAGVEKVQTMANLIWDITEDNSGMLWISTGSKGMYKFDRDIEQFYHQSYDSDSTNQITVEEIFSICKDQSGHLWYGAMDEREGLIKFNPDTEDYTYYRHKPSISTSISTNNIRSTYTDKSGLLWVGTFQGGLNKFNPITEHFTRYLHKADIPHSLSSNTVTSVYEDHSNVFWVGTRRGINKFDRNSVLFNQLKQNPWNRISLYTLSVTGITETQHNGRNLLWLGTWGKGLFQLDRETGEIIQYRNNPDDPNSLSHDIVSRLVASHKEELWISTFQGLNKLDLSNGKFTRYYHDPGNPNSLSIDVIRSIYLDRSGVLWIGTRDRTLDRFDPDNEKFTHINIGTDDIICFYEDQTDALWIGDDDRLIKLDKNKGTYTDYVQDPEDTNSISNALIFTIYQSIQGNENILWVGTGGGLNKYDYRTEKFKSYTQKDGLPGDAIYTILEDEHGNLWLGTNHGLSKFNPKTEIFRNYDTRDGLFNFQFNWSSCLKSMDGQLFFGGTNGITAFCPDSIKDNFQIPPIVLTDFRIFNESVKITRGGSDENLGVYYLPRHISLLDEIKLSHKESIFSFEFAALDYHSPQKNIYAYKMEGVDPNWVYTDASHRFASYTNLDPGEYTFKVKGTNKDGIWNEEGASISIIILPPWWRTNWAYLFYALLIIGTIYFVWKMQLKRVRIKHDYEMSKFEAEKLHEVDEMKSKFFANLSHEFRTPLTLIFGPAKDIMEDYDDVCLQNLSDIF